MTVATTPLDALAEPAPWPDPLTGERPPEHLRRDAIAHGEALARRHGDDLLGTPLRYADVVAATANRRLQLVTSARSSRLASAQARLAGAIEARDIATARLDAALAAAQKLGVDDVLAPLLGYRVCGSSRFRPSRLLRAARSSARSCGLSGQRSLRRSCSGSRARSSPRTCAGCRCS